MSDIGAGSLWDPVRVGTFRMNSDTAVRCARQYRNFGDSLQRYLVESAGLREFGEFESGAQSQPGFAGKVGRHRTLLGMQESAYRMAAAYLRAGGAIEEADRVHALAISRMNQ